MPVEPDGYEKKPSPEIFGAGFWRCPTLARPIAALPSGLQRFTAVFGMGTGGATALLSPEVRAGLAFRCTAATPARVGISDDDVDRTVSKELLVL